MGMDALTNSTVYQQTRPVTTTEAAPACSEAQSAAAATGTQQSYDFTQNIKSDGRGELKGRATDDEIRQAIASANRRAHFGHTNAEFSYHEPTKRISVKIIDKDTNEVIREIPPEETLEMISKMWELAGIMVDEKR